MLVAPLSWAAPSSQTRFKDCARYDSYIAQSVKEFWARDFQKPIAWKAQLYQESLCKPKAVSPVGAKGIAQFMDGTAKEMARIFRKKFNPDDAREAIRYGAYYVNRNAKMFRRRQRTHEQALELGQACYNAGCGNVLKAQRISGNKRLWDEISPFMVQVTGRSNSHETITYVSRIKRWRREMGDCFK